MSEQCNSILKKDCLRGSTSAFKQAQLRYRRQGTDPNNLDLITECLDFSNPDGDSRIAKITFDNIGESPTNWLADAYNGPLFGIHDAPGFLYAPSALSPSLQSMIAYLSLTEFCEKPHVTNIENVPIKPNEDANMNQGMWELYKLDLECASVKSTSRRKKPFRSLEKLTWATMGWHYDWTARTYRDGALSPMPSILDDISQPFAKASLLLEKAQSTQFTPSAAIVNYYNLKSTMGGHRDDLEFALDKPVVSLSVGLPGVFLLGGGQSSEDSPVLPILVRSGDVLILGGDARMRYHGMARVLPMTERVVKWDMSTVPIDDRIFLESFLSQHRININVRQVLPDGIESIAAAKKNALIFET